MGGLVSKVVAMYVGLPKYRGLLTEFESRVLLKISAYRSELSSFEVSFEVFGETYRR